MVNARMHLQAPGPNNESKDKHGSYGARCNIGAGRCYHCTPSLATVGVGSLFTVGTAEAASCLIPSTGQWVPSGAPSLQCTTGPCHSRCDSWGTLGTVRAALRQSHDHVGHPLMGPTSCNMRWRIRSIGADPQRAVQAHCQCHTLWCARHQEHRLFTGRSPHSARCSSGPSSWRS